MEEKKLPTVKEDIIKYIVDSKRGVYLKENYIKKYFTSLYKEVNEYIDNHKIDYKVESKSNDVKEEFKIKFWYYINNIKETVVCESCGVKTTFNRNFKEGFRKRCSIHAQRSDSSIKRKNTILNSDKYLDEFGNHVDNVSKSLVSKSNAANTGFQKWATTYSTAFGETWLKKTIQVYTKYNITLLQTDVGGSGFVYKFRCNDCLKEFDITVEMLSRRKKHGVKICLECNPLNPNVSLKEQSIFEWIKKILPSGNILPNNKNFGIELDIYIPDKKFAIEFNGLYWHSDIYKKDRNYHYKKTSICKNNEISLLHIWEDDWDDDIKREILKSIIKYKLGIIENKIYARKCVIKMVNYSEKDIFLKENHVQGTSRSTINIGLYNNNELISIMTFGRRKITNSKTELELLRFCNKKNHLVIGAASRLFKYFNNNYDFTTLISFCDVSQFSGEIYLKLGFSFMNHSINYWWVDSYEYIRHHRYKFAKHKLVEKGFDSRLSENEIMKLNGYYKIWGCGMDKYIYTKS